MTTEIVPASARPQVPSTLLPELVERAGVAARFAWGEFFFAATIRTRSLSSGKRVSGRSGTPMKD